MATKKKGTGQFYNKSAVYPHNPSFLEGTKDAQKRRDRSCAVGWPGSISIHGNLLKPNKKVMVQETEDLPMIKEIEAA
jgi:hypothetical protein